MQPVSSSQETSLPASGNSLPLPSATGAFIINLSSSTTPVALQQPSSPELKKFTFFVTRRKEDRRERFRLHMGYFATQHDAERLLEIVREVYPGAWAGVAPGRLVPVPEPAPQARAAAPAAPRASAAPPVAAAPAPPPVQPAPAQKEHLETTQSLTSVRAAIDALEDTPAGTTLSKTATIQLLEGTGTFPALTRPAVNPTPPTLQPPARSPAVAAKVSSAATAPAAPASSFREAVPAPAKALTEALAGFVVQLRWSVEPINLNDLVPLAIFDAYTLYRSKVMRDGRRWHTLRLGFFSDLNSAKQVANYVRSEFPDVSVVPVTALERDRARDAAAAATGNYAALTAAGTARSEKNVAAQFKLIDDGQRRAPQPEIMKFMMTSSEVPAGDSRSAKGVKPSAAPARQSIATDPPARSATRKPPATLEETLDILGAGQLSLDDSRKELLSASGARKMQHAANKKGTGKSSLGRLFERLAERTGH
jgi:hypothetical protein